MNISDLESRNYFRVPGDYVPLNGNYFYQKTIRDNGFMLFFINVIVYDWEQSSFGFKTGLSFVANVHFYTVDENQKSITFDLNLHCDDMTVEQMEAFCHSVYVNMKCVPDIHNN